MPGAAALTTAEAAAGSESMAKVMSQLRVKGGVHRDVSATRQPSEFERDSGAFAG